MIVIDASVAGKWLFKGEQSAVEAIKILASHVLGKEKIIVPDLFFYEIANAVATKGFLSLWKISYTLTKIYQTGLQTYHPSEIDIKEAVKLARKYKTSVYEMLYAIVARNQRTSLITADGKFVKQTKFKFVKLLKDI